MHKQLKCYKQYDKTEQKQLNCFLECFYDDLIESEKYVNNISSTVETSNNISASLISKHMASEWIPMGIKEYIFQNIDDGKTTSIIYKTKIKNKHITLTFYDFPKSVSVSDINNIQTVWLVIYFLNLYALRKCSTDLNIDIFLTKFKRKYPKNKSDIIGPDNVNGGLSSAGCITSSQIIIYREEEWFKVLIHELFHNFSLDFGEENLEQSIKLMRNFAGVESEYKLYETYCETWARVINICVNSFINASVQKTERARRADYLRNFNSFIQSERIFSLMQANKILSRFKNIEDYREKSNVYCYYILAACLINDPLRFIDWCAENNPRFINFNDNVKNIKSFTNLIIEEMSNNDYNSALKCVKELNIKSGNSMRMTIQ